MLRRFILWQRMATFALWASLSVLAGQPSLAQSLPVPDTLSGVCRGDENLSDLPADSALLRIVAALGRAAPAVQQVWPGYWRADEEVLLHRDERAVLWIAPSRPPDGITPLLRGTQAAPMYLYYGSIQEFWPAAGRNVPGMDDPAAPWALPMRFPEIRWNLEVIYHEHFHRFQRRNFKDPRTPRGPGAPHVIRMREPEFARSLEIEHRILHAALGAADSDSVRALLRSYLAVRHARTSGDSLTRWSERQMERIEGVAEYVERDATRLALDCNVDMVRNRLRRDLADYDVANAVGVQGDRRSYFAGAAVAHLLDRLGAEWKRQVQDGRYLDELLAASVAFHPRDAPELIRTALQRFGSRG